MVTGHHMVLPGGHASIVHRHTGPTDDAARRWSRSFMGEFPRITMALALRLCREIYADRASLAILVNDWYALKQAMFALPPEGRAAARQHYWASHAEAQLIFPEADRHLADLSGLSGVRGRAMFSELALKNRFDAIINGDVSISPYGFTAGYGHRDFVRDYAEAAADEGARREFALDDGPALTCQRSADGGCAEEVFMLLGELGRLDVDHVVLFLPLVCRNPVGIGARVAATMFPALADVRITCILMNQFATDEPACFDGCVVEEIG
jgi:hypothetical protein